MRLATAACPILLGVLLLGSVRDSFGTGFLLHRPESASGSLTLDSFSAPSLATAILKQEVLRLLTAYHEQQDQLSHLAAVGSGGRATGAAAVSKVGASAPPEHTPALGETIMALEQLQHRIQVLHLTLDSGLLGVYAATGRAREFVDRYLHLAHEAPGHGELVVWFATAVEAAQRCGRIQEFTEALGQLVRFPDNTGTLQTLAKLLEQARPWPAGAVLEPTRRGGVAATTPGQP